MKPKVLVTREVFPEVIRLLGEYFEVDDNQSDDCLSAEDLKSRVADKDGVMTAVSDRVDADFIAAAPKLKAVCNIGVGFNNVDLNACTGRGVMVTNTPGILDETTADMGWALLMASARRVPAAERWLRNGKWDRWKFVQWLGDDVHHATIGIVGMGRIGQAMAKRAAGFNMRVVYHNRNKLAETDEKTLNATWVDKETLLKTSDFVVLLVPYSTATHHLIGADELALMKPTAHLINIARGGVVNDVALIEALRLNKIAGAGLDVFEGEPALSPDFFTLDNVVLTPHIGSSSYATRMAMAMGAATNLIEVLSGRRPPNLVNTDVYCH